MSFSDEKRFRRKLSFLGNCVSLSKNAWLARVPFSETCTFVVYFDVKENFK